jgi:hypothetical protein
MTLVFLDRNMVEVLHAVHSSKFLGYEMKERGMGGACSTHILKETAYRVWLENSKERDCLEVIGLIGG